MLRPKELGRFLVDHFKKNPEDALRTAVDAAALRVDVPMALLRHVLGALDLGKKGPKDIQLEPRPPSLHVSATVDAMGTMLRVSSSIRIDSVDLSQERLFFSLRLSNVKLELVGESDSPVATLIKSGVLDLSKPGNLIKFVPKKPALIVLAEDDRIDIDLMKLPNIAKNAKLAHALRVVTPVLGIRAVHTEASHLSIALKATPRGAPKAWGEYRKARTRATAG